MIRIETERLVVRNYKEKDVVELWEIISHPRANCFIDEALNTSEETVLDSIRKRENELHVAVCLKIDDTLIGNIFTEKEEPDTYSIGWQFNEKYKGKGYANESARAFYGIYFFYQKS